MKRSSRPKKTRTGSPASSWTLKKATSIFIMVDQRGEHTIRNGIGEWMDGGTTMTGNYLHHQYQNEIEPYGVWRMEG